MGTRFTASSPVIIALLGCALALNGTWVMGAFQSVGIFAFADHGESVLDAVYLVSITVLSLTLLLVGYFEHGAGRLLARRGTFWVSAACTVLATLAMPLGGLPSPEGSLFVAGTGVLSGVASALFLMYFGMALSRVSLREATAAVAIGQIASPLLFSFSLVLSPPPALAFTALLPVGAAVALWAAIRRIREAAQISVIELADQHPLTDATSIARSRASSSASCSAWPSSASPTSSCAPSTYKWTSRAPEGLPTPSCRRWLGRRWSSALSSSPWP